MEAACVGKLQGMALGLRAPLHTVFEFKGLAPTLLCGPASVFVSAEIYRGRTLYLLSETDCSCYVLLNPLEH